MEVRTFQPERITPPRGYDVQDFLARRLPGLPLEVEIGAGVGWHALRYAEAHPDRFLVAIEKTRDKFARFKRRLAHHPYRSNLYAVHGDAIAWITRSLPREVKVQRYWLLYPNPERTNPAKRWFRMPFFAWLLESLEPGGEVVLATNERDYAGEAERWAGEVWNLTLFEKQKWTRDRQPPGGFRTHFEKKYLTQGMDCWELRFQKSRAGDRQDGQEKVEKKC